LLLEKGGRKSNHHSSPANQPLGLYPPHTTPTAVVQRLSPLRDFVLLDEISVLRSSRFLLAEYVSLGLWLVGILEKRSDSCHFLVVGFRDGINTR
jgi:hypothetical protein